MVVFVSVIVGPTISQEIDSNGLGQNWDISLWIWFIWLHKIIYIFFLNPEVEIIIIKITKRAYRFSFFLSF